MKGRAMWKTATRSKKCFTRISSIRICSRLLDFILSGRNPTNHPSGRRSKKPFTLISSIRICSRLLDFILSGLNRTNHPSDSKSLQWHMILMELGVLQALLVRLRDGSIMDEEELERGQIITTSLPEAIEESRYAIVVLSPSYASSTWCLDELQKIIHLKEESSVQVFPIFYGVDPSNVRKQEGSFAEAFQKHEERFTKDKMKVQGWRDALKKVATISGWHSKNRSRKFSRHPVRLVACGYLRRGQGRR
ncbi:hypothetical protein K1719_044943 [Acacia pycnantha]|nr:hypothetical protein K1719_044943 [Acacia pycnantha]